LKLSVSLSYNLFEPLTYRCSDAAPGLKTGSRVLVPLGKRFALGWVLAMDSPYSGRLKNIIGIIDDPFFPDASLLAFARQAGAAYFTSAGSVLEHSLPPSQKNLKKLLMELDGQIRKITEFTPAQLEKLSSTTPLRFFYKAGSEVGAATLPLEETAFASRLLLDTQPGAEYRTACEQALAKGRSVILLVPDNATARYWQSVLPGVDPYHSEVKVAAREKIWRQYQQGKCGIVCGGIAALTLPLANAGLLVIDRASAPLYQRSAGSPFRTDHLAEMRAQTAGIPLWRGALAHSCATYERRNEAGLEDRRQEQGIVCQVHALKGRERGIPAEIVALIGEKFLAKKKTLVLVNRIQPAVHLFCESCQRIAVCPRCGGSLQVDESKLASCRRCAYRKEALSECPRCGQVLTSLHDLSIESLSRAVVRISGENEVLTLTATELKEPEQAVAAVESHPIVIATLAALNPFFKGLFAAAIWVKPESFFNMEDFNAAEMIHASGAEIGATLHAPGELHVFSVFHFHYALQYLMDEAKFFERELKYRQWFLLPPFASVYELELRDASLRSLAATMRELNGKHKKDLQIKRIYLAARQPLRGTFRGTMELHATPEKIAAAGLHRIKRSTLRRTAG
jgi:primosomal protein N'